RRALWLARYLALRLRPRHLDCDVELEFEVRDLGVQHRGVVVAIDFVQVPHALDAGREEARIAQLGENRRARRLEVDVAGELHRRVTGAARAPGFRSGERYCTRTTSPGGATQRKGGREDERAAAGIVAHRPCEVKSRACRRGFRSISGHETRATRLQLVLEDVFSEKWCYFT